MKKFALLKYKPCKCWSNRLKDYYYSTDIKDQIWAHDGIPLKTDLLSLEDVIKYVSANPGTDKKTRSAILRFDSTVFPLKDYVGLDKWNGFIFVDLDFDKCSKIANLSNDKLSDFYTQLDYALQNICPRNYAYIEHSSSGIGIHCLFYFDCDGNELNYKKYAKYVYDVFRYKIDEHIKDFSFIFTNPDCLKDNGQSVVFDEIYERPYQKCFITTKDYKIYNVDGYCDDIEVEEDEVISYDEEPVTDLGKIKVTYVNKQKKYELHYYDRLYVLTALKRFVKDRKEAYKLWHEFCKSIVTYKNYTTKDFINMFEQNWHKVDASTGHLLILKMYGFKVDDSEISYYLNEGQYLSDVAEDIIKNSVYGLNMLVAGTGVGKTKSWILLNEKYSQPLEMTNHRPILIVEPLNSIIESKYDEAKFRIVTGNKQLGNIDTYEMIITNYNHLVSYSVEGIEIKEDLDKFFSKFELVVIDESHIMLKDIFRSEVLVPFLISLNKVKSTKIILQTATEMFEKSILDIKKTFYVNKPDRIKKKIIYRYDKCFDIQNITCFVDYYIANKKKVYVYWNNGSLQKMKQFKKCYHSPENVVIYHKRNIGDNDMQYVTNFHNIDDFNIILSSVYFGVGNDLEDKIKDVAVIIIGNNSWQEDIQAIGRWRNVEHIECCIVLDSFDMAFVKSTSSTVFDFDSRYEDTKKKYLKILNDAFNRDKSVMINNVAFKIKNTEYCDILAKMQTACEYSSQFLIKNNEFKRRGYDVRTEIKNLEVNKGLLENVKKYKKDLQAIRNKCIRDMVEGNFDYDKIDEDTKLIACAKIIKALRTRDLMKYCNLEHFIISKILKYDTFLKYYKMVVSDKSDYAELFSILWVRKNIDETSKEIVKIGNYEIGHDQYVMLYGYLIWLSYRNKDDNKEMINYNYYYKFVKICEDMCAIEDELIERLFAIKYHDDEYNEFYKEFFDLNSDIYIDDNKEVTEDSLYEQITKLDIDKEYYKKIMKLILSFYDAKKNKKAAGKIGGETGGKKGKKIVIDGVEYDTVSDAAKALNTSRSQIYRLMKKNE